MIRVISFPAIKIKILLLYLLFFFFFLQRAKVRKKEKLTQGLWSVLILYCCCHVGLIFTVNVGDNAVSDKVLN